MKKENTSKFFAFLIGLIIVNIFTLKVTLAVAPSTPVIGGANWAWTGGNFDLIVYSKDPENENIMFEVDWDNNGTVDGTTSYFVSNSYVNIGHTYSSYTGSPYLHPDIKVRAKDIGGATSAWSTYNVSGNGFSCEGFAGSNPFGSFSFHKDETNFPSDPDGGWPFAVVGQKAHLFVTTCTSNPSNGIVLQYSTPVTETYTGPYAYHSAVSGLYSLAGSLENFTFTGPGYFTVDAVEYNGGYPTGRSQDVASGIYVLPVDAPCIVSKQTCAGASCTSISGAGAVNGCSGGVCTSSSAMTLKAPNNTTYNFNVSQSSNINQATYNQESPSSSTVINGVSYRIVNTHNHTIVNDPAVGSITRVEPPLPRCPASLPPGTPTLGGTTSVNTGVSTANTVVATDPEGDNIYYEIDWDGNGTVDGTTASQSSGASTAIGNIYSTAGTYGVRARAVQTTDPTKVSAWSAPYNITVNPTSYNCEAGSFNPGLGILTNNSTSVIGFAINTATRIYHSVFGGACFYNNSGINYFIPTKTSTEFNSFITNLPAGVTRANGTW